MGPFDSGGTGGLGACTVCASTKMKNGRAMAEKTHGSRRELYCAPTGLVRIQAGASEILAVPHPNCAFVADTWLSKHELYHSRFSIFCCDAAFEGMFQCCRRSRQPMDMAPRKSHRGDSILRCN